MADAPARLVERLYSTAWQHRCGPWYRYPQVKMFEINLSQRAKTGKGGILPGVQVIPEIAAVRSIRAGQDSIMHAPSDATVGIENAQRIVLAAKHPRSFISLDYADHLLSSPDATA